MDPNPSLPRADDSNGSDEVAAAVPLEIELKLFVPPSSVGRVWTHPWIVAHAIGPLRVSRLENRYFDTADRALAAAGMALRLRRRAGQWVQTLKTSAADEGALSVRGEWEMPVRGPALELARLKGGALDRIASPRTIARRLAPVFTTDFRRESRLLRLRDGGVVELAFDVGLIGVGRGRSRRTLPICEIEIEAKGDGTTDTPPDLMRFAARLVRDLALIPLAASKAARGFRLADRMPPAVVRVDLPPAEPTESPARHLAAVLVACNRALLANAHALFERTASPANDAAGDTTVDLLHQSRVAIRRMRSALRTFRDVDPGGHRFESLDAQLAATGRVFGDARDWDVFLTTSMKRIDDEVATDAPGRDALAEVIVEATRMRADARARLMQFLDAGAFGRTTIAVERLAARLAARGAARSAKPLGDRAPGWLTAQKDRVVVRARRIAVLDADQRHGLRIEVKRLRYALDLLDALYDRDAVKGVNEAVADLQDKLGALNDLVVADRLMQTLPATPALALVRARFGAWLDRHVRKQLPKVAALSVALELTPPPWATS